MKKLKSDLRLTIDKSGRSRIGGKFASNRQVGAWKAARTRRKLSTNARRLDTSKTASSKRRSEQSKKAAATRKLKRLGGSFVSDRVTARQGIRFRSYDLEDIDPNLIQSIIDRETVGLTRGVLVYPVVEAEDDEGDEINISVQKGFFRNAFDPNIVSTIIDDFGGLVFKYAIQAVTKFSLVFTFSFNN